MSQIVNKTTSFSWQHSTDLKIGNEWDSMVNGHSADEEVILHVSSIVIGQVDHQVDMTLTDQSINKKKKQQHMQKKKLKEIIQFKPKAQSKL